MKTMLLIVTAFLLGCTPSPRDAVLGELRQLSCDVAIVGGGAGGLHTAYRLGPQFGPQVCLFEKEDRLGGRIYDIAKEPGGPLVGVGARRIMEGQDYLFTLADELGIKYEKVPWPSPLIAARGLKKLNSNDLRQAYGLKEPGLSEADIYDKLFQSPLRQDINRYPDLRSYIRTVAGEEAHRFLSDVSRLRYSLEYPLNASSGLDYIERERANCCVPSYPVGGMSAFIRGMEAGARSRGVRIFTGEPVNEISGQNGDYTIVTSKQVVRAQKVIVAVDAYALKNIGGSIADAIKSQPQLDALSGVRVVTITQWWPRPWWHESQLRGNNIGRAWTTEHCLNTLEIPLEKYTENEFVTRSVYVDDITCVQFWENIASLSPGLMEDEIARGIKDLFPDIALPSPVKTHMQVWPAAWYLIKNGSQFENEDIVEWAANPLPGENVWLVSESYYPQRAGWSDGAYRSSINVLNGKFGLNLPVPQLQKRILSDEERQKASVGP